MSTNMSTGAQASPQRSILIIALAHTQGTSETRFNVLLRQIRSKALVKIIYDPEEAYTTIRQTQAPTTILIADEALTLPEYSMLRVWRRVQSFMIRGGTCIIMGDFASKVEYTRVRPFFAGAEVSWNAGRRYQQGLSINEQGAGQAVASKITPYISSKVCLTIENAGLDEAWYIVEQQHPNESVEPQESPVAVAVIAGAGRLGYVGGVAVSAECWRTIVLAMCGIEA
ncbi:hypothetical protein N7504_002946 [Penicillium tannophilum]|nr:hypothetical protein N7504_002946 [Penicillium tannophilum]